MSKVAVVYWSGTGNTGVMAQRTLNVAKEIKAKLREFES